jgi:hypothetical protein
MTKQTRREFLKALGIGAGAAVAGVAVGAAAAECDVKDALVTVNGTEVEGLDFSSYEITDIRTERPIGDLDLIKNHIEYWAQTAVERGILDPNWEDFKGKSISHCWGEDND